MSNGMTSFDDKVKILAAAARYDVSCSSSGSRRTGGAGLGSTEAAGVCHSFTEDGRCISLLKLLLTNVCVHDCAYCVNREGNDIPRAAFSETELVDLTLQFYRRNYIEGLFLSSGVARHPDDTMERLVRVAATLRRTHGFRGYIHLKCIPGADPRLVREAGLWADRLSVNIELPSEDSLRRLSSRKTYADILGPMDVIRAGIDLHEHERRRFRSAPLFTPAGQSTQLIVGASPESDRRILTLADALYRDRRLKRVYYSGFVPVNPGESRLPALAGPPLVREHRLYQADWLLRCYGFALEDILPADAPDLSLDIDPKTLMALRHPHWFPVDVNRAPYEVLIRVPGLGITSARKILEARRQGELRYDHLRRMGVVLKRAANFIECPDHPRYRSRSLPPPSVAPCRSDPAIAPGSRVPVSGTAHTGADQGITLTYDGTFAGLLCVIFDTYARKLPPAEIRHSRRGQLSLFSPDVFIETDAEKAARVWRRLTTLPGDMAESLYHAFLSEVEGVESLIRKVIHDMLRPGSGPRGGKGSNDPEMLDRRLSVDNLARSVRREAHRMLGFVRFDTVGDGLYAAPIAPIADTLPLMRRHFEARFADQRWMIYDTRRRYGIYFDGRESGAVSLNLPVFEGRDLADPDGLTWRRLWKSYFDAMTIPERRNPGLHMRLLPKRLWRYLPEKEAVGAGNAVMAA